jgi:1,2-phenylacetyl-CoA epoxidase catalytic subunit
MSDLTLLDVGKLDDATRSALRRLILTLADSKRLMGIRYSDWLLGSPSIETGIAASSMAQDEWGHARLLYAMLKDLGEDPVVVEHERPAKAYASVDPLDAPFPDWAAVVAGMTVVDVALAVALDACAHGCFEPATTRVPKMCAEEEFHRSLAFAWYRRLAASRSDEARGLLRAATEAMLPATLAWLGADDAAARALVDAGVTRSGAELSASFRDAVGDVLRTGSVDVDAMAPATAWDAARARGPGHPDEEAVERARGDRNRMLFVE